MANKPRIRFRGFTEDWEQRKLGDIATFSKGNGYSKSDLAPSGDPIILYGRLYTNYETTIRNVDTFVELKDKSVISQGDEVIVPASGETVEDISRASVVKDQGVIIGGDLNVIKVNHLLDPTFLALTISNGEQQKELSKRAQGKSVVHLHNSDLQEVNLTFPLLNEQKEISTLFEKMDSIITLHQCKLKKLNLAKKSLLQKLFPRNGSQIPGVRFKGFTDAWEQRKFLDLLDTQNGIRRGPFGSSLKKDSFVKKSDYVVYEQQNAIYDNYVTRYFISKEKYNELIRFNIQPGDFIMSGAGTIGRISMVPDGIKKGVFNQALIRFKVDKNSVNPLYFLKFMQSDMMQKQLTQANPGSAMTNLVPMDELKKWDVTIPSLEEQNKISNFINQIDESITLHQRKLERLQEVKKGLLQKMFV
ncbi:MAG: restriction endonuclease subunit S [Veillonella sp.]|nr:restriction endonuclease subunit S [Veillonella sp.]